MKLQPAKSDGLQKRNEMNKVQSRSKTKLDMTRGPIMKLIVLFAIPMVIGNIL